MSVLCPTFVNTRIVEAERNRPPDLWNEGSPSQTRGWDALADRLRNGVSPSEMAGIVIEAVRKGQFYIIPPDYNEENFRRWAEDLLARRNPVYRGLAQGA